MLSYMDNLNEPQQTCWSARTLTLGSAIVHKHELKVKVRVKDVYSSMHQNSKHKDQD